MPEGRAGRRSSHARIRRRTRPRFSNDAEATSIRGRSVAGTCVCDRCRSSAERLADPLRARDTPGSATVIVAAAVTGPVVSPPSAHSRTQSAAFAASRLSHQVALIRSRARIRICLHRVRALLRVPRPVGVRARRLTGLRGKMVLTLDHMPGRRSQASTGRQALRIGWPHGCSRSWSGTMSRSTA
jgi:hypothetical protein